MSARRKLFAAVLFAVWMAADASAAEMPFPDDTIKQGAAAGKDPMLQPGDKISMVLYPKDEHIAGGDMQISNQGFVTIPLLGKIYLAGMNLRDAERKLTEIIDADYIIDPEIVLSYLSVRSESVSISILGAVSQPGSFEVEVKGERVTLIKAVLKAGGFSDVANIKKIKIIRQKNGEKEVLRVNGESIISGKEDDLVLEDGDIIHVAESIF